jgi:hypothetical protein
LRPPAGKRYKEMPGLDVLVEYPAGRACAALVELLYAEPVPAGIVVAEKGGRTA